jgi:hypothetical protein
VAPYTFTRADEAITIFREVIMFWAFFFGLLFILANIGANTQRPQH